MDVDANIQGLGLRSQICKVFSTSGIVRSIASKSMTCHYNTAEQKDGK